MKICYPVTVMLLLLVLLFCNCNQKTSIAFLEIEVTWRLDANVTTNGSTSHTATFWLINKGKSTLDDQGWVLHWNQSPRLVVTSEGPAKVENINGDFYRMVPLPGFSLAPGDTVSVSYTSNDWLIKESDAPLGLYFAFESPSGAEETLSVSSFKILPFESANQYTRSPDDMEPFPDAGYLFQRNARLSTLLKSECYPFIPAPAFWKYGEGVFEFPVSLSISCPASLEMEGKYLVAELKKRFGAEAKLIADSGTESQIQLSLDGAIQHPEGYRLDIQTGKSIQIAGGTSSGAFYGIQSLLSLMTKNGQGKLSAPLISIADQPAFAYRGQHLDVSRNFQSKETVLRLLDMMARFKLNRLLFNLTEDEAWRIEIKGLPELTEVGGRRGHKHRDSLYLQPAYGSGPDADNPASHGNGFYTREDFKEIIRYAHERHIEVIPEINLPGHARAAIKAMELRYRRLMKAGKKHEAVKYRLIDPADTSRYISAQGYFDNTACVCQEQPLRFFETAVDDIMEMFKEAAVPLRMFHTGGDEVPSTAWTGSPLCREFLKNYPEIKNTRNLQGLFFGQMVEALRTRGLMTGTWEEAVMQFEDGGTWRSNPRFVGKEVYPYIWNNLWGNQDLGYKLATGGYPVILCNVTNFYFDLAYSRDPREPGLYWAGFVDEEDAFSFVPYNLFESTRTDALGKPFEPSKDFTGMQRLTPEARKNIAGLQAQLWSETIKGRDMLEYYYLPKMLGFAQRAWQGDAPWSGKGETARIADFNKFINTAVQVEFPFLETYQGGYNFRISPPGIKVENGQVFINTGYPGFQVRFTTDGTEPTSQSKHYEGPFALIGNIIKAATFNSKGRSGFSTTLVIN